jgi:hypothetical protein
MDGSAAHVGAEDRIAHALARLLVAEHRRLGDREDVCRAPEDPAAIEEGAAVGLNHRRPRM